MKSQKFISLGAKLGSTIAGAGIGAVKGGIKGGVDAYKSTGKKIQPVQTPVKDKIIK